jgi:hypothetical protein
VVLRHGGEVVQRLTVANESVGGQVSLGKDGRNRTTYSVTPRNGRSAFATYIGEWDGLT